jgi:hypothetical protein
MDKMKAYPLAVLNLVEAKEKQFRLIDMITKNFTGAEVLQWEILA